MLLAVDVGNTNVVFALFEGREIRTRWRIATDPRRTGDEYAVWLSQLMAIEGIERGEVHAMIVSTVVPRARHNIEVLGQKYFGVTPTFAGEGGWPIEIDVDEPAGVLTGRSDWAHWALLSICAVLLSPLGYLLTGPLGDLADRAAAALFLAA